MSNNFEIRFFVIGDFQVGKKSIVQRFKRLNSTETEEDNYFIQGDPKDEYGLGKTRTKISEEKFAKYQQLEPEEKNMVRKQIERKSLMKFKKVFIVGHTRLELNFFPIESPEEKIVTGVTENKDEEDEIKVGNKLINLKKVIDEIKKLLTKDPKDQNANLENIFFFVYDLKDFSTFKKIEIYHNKLNNFFKIDDNYFKVLVGNKADSHMPFTKREKDYFDNFVKNNNIKHYEISTYNYFNFEKFFEHLFMDIMAPIDEELQKLTFVNRFHLVLHSRATLSRAERKIHHVNEVPFLGEKENPDVYAYPEDKAEFRRTFSNMKRGRYAFKIFINKQGPTFPASEKQGIEKNKQAGILSKPETALTRDKKSKTTIGFGNWELNNRNKKIREALQTNIPGYSLGIKSGKLGFKKERKQKFQEREHELKSALQQNYVGLTIRKEGDMEKRNIDYIENKKEILKDLISKVHENEYKHLKDREKNKQKQNSLIKDKIEKIKTKQDKYQKIYEKTKLEIQQKKSGLMHPKTAVVRRGKTPFTRKNEIPAYTLYDISTKYDPNKGWTMGMKYNYNPDKNKDDPEFPKLKSDFDRIVDCPKYAEIKYTAPRFKKVPIVKISQEERKREEDDRKRYEEKVDLIKKNGERAINLRAFLEERKDKRDRVMENKLELIKERNEEIEKLKERMPRTIGTKRDHGYSYNVDIPEIHYHLVEESAPNYTIKGRHIHGSIFGSKDNYSVINNDDDDEENKIGSNGKPIQDEEYKKSLPVPQFDVVKPSFPNYSFSKAKRFFDKPLYHPSPNAIPVIPFEKGEFKPADVKTFSTIQGYMSKAKKNTYLKYNGIPGPGQYKIKGFAEKIADEGRKICERRARSRKEREMRELMMKMKNEEISKNMEVNEHNKRNVGEDNMVLKITDSDHENDNENSGKH